MCRRGKFLWGGLPNPCRHLKDYERKSYDQTDMWVVKDSSIYSPVPSKEQQSSAIPACYRVSSNTGIHLSPSRPRTPTKNYYEFTEPGHLYQILQSVDPGFYLVILNQLYLYIPRSPPTSRIVRSKSPCTSVFQYLKAKF